MKNMFLVKSGEYRPNLFSDLSHMVNNNSGRCFSEVLRFVKRTDYTFRLMRDSRVGAPSNALALVTYTYDPLVDKTDPTKFFPIDIPFIVDALNSNEFVMVGHILTANTTVSENMVLQGLSYYGRNDQGKLIDLKTGETIVNPMEVTDGNKFASFISMMGIVKAGTLPLFYMILDNGIVSAVDLMEYTDTDTIIYPVHDYDGPIASHLMKVMLSNNITKVGDHHLFVKGQDATLEFFTEQWCSRIDPLLFQTLPNATITGDCKYTVDGPRILLKVEKPVSTLKIEFDLGRFFKMVGTLERPSVEFIIYAA